MRHSKEHKSEGWDKKNRIEESVHSEEREWKTMREMENLLATMGPKQTIPSCRFIIGNAGLLQASLLLSLQST